MEPFYFTSYDRVIGIAGDVRQLDREMKRLAREDRGSLEYHLANDHIVLWLESGGEEELAKDLTGVKNIEQAINIIEKYISKSYMMHRMKRGRMH